MLSINHILAGLMNITSHGRSTKMLEGEDEDQPPLHEDEVQAGHHFDLNVNPGTHN
jgi:hypothetical protein